MENNNNRSHSKKVRNLVILSFLCALVLGVSTYAWFIGMKTVNVSTFDVKVATTEGLYISLDGKSWAYNLDINDESTYADYTKNTNKIKNVELIPVSTVGRIDKTASTMIMYEKGSLTSNDIAKGYRLLASRVRNYPGEDDNGTNYTLSTNGTGQENPDVAETGYLVFDLFIKNVSGEEYYVANNVNNEEAIYLTTNSKVTASGPAGTGIENSVRVAFAQIGRVEDVKDNEGEKATAITCADEGFTVSEGNVTFSSGVTSTRDTVTGICRDAYIWEPNDRQHEQNAINWYTTSVEQMTETGHIAPVAPALTEYYTTSAIATVINTDNAINIYDRAATLYVRDQATITDATYMMDYFTDTEKLLKGTERPQFMTLAPNSITKVRVYVYLEGQDIDNYDFASLGQQISVNFGFTKERFQEDDIDYSGPNTYITPTDTTPVTTNGTEIENGRENDKTNSVSTPGNRTNTDSIANAYR